MKKSKETMRDASRSIPNLRKELFAELYTFEFWGKPLEAAARAGYKILTPKKIRILLTDPLIADRIRYLRKQIASQTIADEAWIKNKFVDIVLKADKPADQLKALAELYRAIAESEKTTPEKKEEESDFFPLDEDDL